MLKVLKFGGSSVGCADSIKRTADIVFRNHINKIPQIVVVSAMYGVTNKLEKYYFQDKNPLLINEIKMLHNQTYNELFCDHINIDNLSSQYNVQMANFIDKYSDKYIKNNSYSGFVTIGEALSVNLLSRYMSSIIPTHPVYTNDLIIMNGDTVDFDISNRLIKKKIINVHDEGYIPIVTGFMAGDNNGNIKTLNRGGSDYTASIIASAMKASCVELWKLECTKKDNGFMDKIKPLTEQRKWLGIVSANPTHVKNAEIVDTIGYVEANILSKFGKKVIHPKAVEPLLISNIPLYVKNTAIPEDEGTVITKKSNNNPKVIVDQQLKQFIDENGTNIIDPDVKTLMENHSDIIAVIGPNLNNNDNFKNCLNSYCKLKGFEYTFPKKLFGDDNFVSIFAHKKDKDQIIKFTHSIISEE